MFPCLTGEDPGPQLVAEAPAGGDAVWCRPLSAGPLHPSGSCPALPHPCITNAGLTLSPGHPSPSLLNNLGPWHGLPVRRPSPRRPTALHAPSRRLLQFPQGLPPRAHSPFTRRHSRSPVLSQRSHCFPEEALHGLLVGLERLLTGQGGPRAPALGGTCHPAAGTVLPSAM